MKLARIYSDGKLAIKGELIEKVKEEPLLYFNGASQAVTIANTNNRLQPSNTLTWEMWFKLDGFTQYNTLMGFSLNNFDFARMDSPTSLKCHIRDSNGGAAYVILEGTPSVYDGEWHHMAIVWDGINGRRWGFLDGVQRHYSTMEAGTNIGSTSPYGSFTIGGATPTSRLIKGWIKEVRLWQIARTQQEIVNDMNVRLTGNEDGLFLYLPLNEGKGRTVIDKASGYVADLGGAIWQGDNKNITLTNSGNMVVYGEYIEGNKNSIQSGRLELIDIIEGGV
ncbi:MAG: LamG domain-containing protein [Tissierellia bacterium]|nr:LamG domain-containing protein [Tissierellia bacterium]